MKKYIIPIIGSLLLMSCQKEILAPEQMIQGKFAFDDGTALTNSYLVFDKGHLSTYISESDRPFAEGKIWRVDGDLFTLSSTVSYSITDGVLNTSSTSAPIELKDGILTIGETKYSLLEGLEHEPYSTIVTDEEQVFSYTDQDIAIPFTVDRPLPKCNLSCSTNTSWITGIAVQEGVIIAHLSATSTDRAGAISLSYPFTDPVVVTIKQQPSTFIRLEEDSRTVDYTAQHVVLPYTIDNPVSGSSLTARTDASWINNIQVSDNEVSFNVTENNTFGSRSAAIALCYEGAPNITFHVTQEYSAPVITLTPSSQTVNYAGGTFSFDYSVANPREGVSIEVSSRTEWMTIVSVSNKTIVYKVTENIGFRTRNGIINIEYSSYASASYSVTQSSSSHIPEGAVDLGLSVLWASCNLGASSPEEYGDYYAWGEVIPYYSDGHSQDDPCSSWQDRSDHPITAGYHWSSYKWCNGSGTTLTKYNNSSSYGTVDNKTQLELSDDAARAELGGAWCIPTRDNFKELVENCTSEWKTLDGKYGRKFTSKKSGYTDKWIFLPAAGYRTGTYLVGPGSNGYYWSSSLYEGDSSRFLYFSSGNVAYYGKGPRCCGNSVRPVYDMSYL